MKKILLIIAIFMISSPAIAGHNGREHGPLQTITVDVNGLVCDFCARALEKTFYQREGVEGVLVNLDTHIVTLEVTEGANLSDGEITELISSAGYNVNKITR